MLKQYEEIAVLEQGDDGAIVSIHGQGAPSILLGASYLGHLERVVHQAGEHLNSLPHGASGTPLRLLLLEMTTLLQTYDATCNKYLGNVAGPKTLAAALEEMEELRKQVIAWEAKHESSVNHRSASLSPTGGSVPNADA